MPKWELLEQVAWKGSHFPPSPGSEWFWQCLPTKLHPWAPCSHCSSCEISSSNSLLTWLDGILSLPPGICQSPFVPYCPCDNTALYLNRLCFLGSYFLDVLVPRLVFFLCRTSLGHHARAKCVRSCPGVSPLPSTVTSALQSLPAHPVLQQYSGLPIVMLLSRKTSRPLALTDNLPHLAAIQHWDIHELLIQFSSFWLSYPQSLVLQPPRDMVEPLVEISQ